MRRVAANLVFLSREKVYTNHILEIYGDRVANHYVLNAELAMTEWLGGIIVLTNADCMDVDGIQSVSDFFDKAENAQHTSRSFRAYHIRNVDMATGVFKENGRICLIEEKIEY